VRYFFINYNYYVLFISTYIHVCSCSFINLFESNFDLGDNLLSNPSECLKICDKTLLDCQALVISQQPDEIQYQFTTKTKIHTRFSCKFISIIYFVCKNDYILRGFILRLSFQLCLLVLNCIGQLYQEMKMSTVFSEFLAQWCEHLSLKCLSINEFTNAKNVNIPMWLRYLYCSFDVSCLLFM